MEKLEYRSSKNEAVATGIYFCALGCLFFAVSILVLPRREALFFLILGVLLLIFAILWLTHETVVKIDLQTKMIMKETKILFFSKRQPYPLSKSKTIQIRRHVNVTEFFDCSFTFFLCIVLTGQRGIQIPGSTSDFAEILLIGQRLSDRMGVPLGYSWPATS